MVRLCPLQVEREIRSLQMEERCKAGRPAVRPAAATEGRLLHKHGVLYGLYLRAARHMEMAKVRTRRRISTPDHFGAGGPPDTSNHATGGQASVR